MDALTDDIICHLATFCSPNDLAKLGRTCQRFGGKPGGFIKRRKKPRKSPFSTRKRQKTTNATSKADADHSRAVEMAGRKWSLMNEAARKIVYAAKETDMEWNSSQISKRMTGNESWVTVHHRLECQWKCKPLKLSRFIGKGIRYVKGDITHVGPRRGIQGYLGKSLVFCQEIMKTGRHYAEFKISLPSYDVFRNWEPKIGLLRPIYDDAMIHTKTQVEMVKKVHIMDHWFPFRGFSEEIPLPRDFEGYCHDNSERPGFEGDEHSYFVNLSNNYTEANLYLRNQRNETDGSVLIGLLLDLDEGTLTGYSQGKSVGVMKRGLRGHYSWTVFPNECTVKIQHAPIPVDDV